MLPSEQQSLLYHRISNSTTSPRQPISRYYVLKRFVLENPYKKHHQKKANLTLGFLRRNLRHCQLSCRKNEYFYALIWSRLEYADIILDPYLQGDIDRFERVQRSAARDILKDYRSREEGCVSTLPMKLKLPSFQVRRQRSSETDLIQGGERALFKISES